MSRITLPAPGMLARMFGRAEPETPLALFQRETERFFDQFGRSLGGDNAWLAAGPTPAVDVTDSPQALVISAELPGMTEKDVEITVQDGVLTLRGEKQEQKEEKEANRYVAERRYGAFMRSFALPAGVDEAGIKATVDNGVLKVTLPKLPEAQSKARRIAITPPAG